jgi:cell division protein FtsL
MRDVMLWGTAVLFLLAALYTVAVRRELYAHARDLGVLERRLLERQRRNDNLALLRERLASPGHLRERAERNGLLGEATR